jgi:hypothetical protein
VPGKVGVGPQSDAGGAEFVSLEAEGPEEEDVGWAERAQEGAGGGEGGEAGGVDVGEDGEEDFAGERRPARNEKAGAAGVAMLMGSCACSLVIDGLDEDDRKEKGSEAATWSGRRRSYLIR